MRSLFALGLVLLVGVAASCSGGTADTSPKEFETATGGKGSGGSTSGGSAGQSSVCATGLMSCLAQGTATGTKCVDVKTDNTNCGTCGTVCPTLTSCSGGSCVCMGTLQNCNNVCTDVKTSGANCGMCGNVCGAATPFCTAGVCSATCGAGETPCNGNSCVNVVNDPTNCGSCNNVCQGGTACNAGVCGCPAGTNICNGACVNFLTDGANCGGCGKPCAGGQSCSAGLCVTGGVGGAAGGSSVGGAGGMSGSGGAAGSGAAGGPPIPPERNGCAIKPGLVADFEEGTAVMAPVVQKIEDRTGEFEMYNDGKGTNQTMTVESSGGTADCDKWALHVKGSGYSEWGAGFGFSLVGPPTGPTPYNATLHNLSGIRFKAKAGSGADSKSPVRFNVSTPWTESKDNAGGQCTPTTATSTKAAVDCYQHAGRFMAPGSGAGQLSSSFQTFTYCFDRDLYPLSLPSNLTPDQRASIGTNMLKIQFQFNAGKDYSGPYTESDYPAFDKALPFDFWIDDVEFITGECPTTFTTPSNGASKPFPQNASSDKYGTACTIASSAKVMNGALIDAYKVWQANFVRNGNTVIAPEQDNVVTSESMGYGMMIAAAMGDKALFEKFWGYVNGKLSGGLMTWKEGQSGSASDGDLDIAYALAMGEAQFGGYASAASSMASNISSKDIVGGVIRGGSSFQNSNFNPSYFIPVAMRKLGISLGSNYGFVNTNIAAGSQRVPTDWANPSNGNPSDAGSAQVTSDITDGSNGAMGYDAARVPWRLGQDVCLGNMDGKGSVDSMVSFFAGQYDSGSRIDLMKAGWYKAKAGPHTASKDVQGSYIGPMGVAGMASGNAAMRDSAFRAVMDILETGDFNRTYFPCTIGFITALIMSGNFPVP